LRQNSRMAEPHVISALVKKRAELAGDLAAHDRKRRAITDGLAHVDSVLAMFGYEDDPKAIKPRRKAPPRMFKRGQLRRTVADIGRQLPDLKDDRAIAVEVVSRLGWDAGNTELVEQVREKVKDVRKVKRAG
jgi:hypothetical protein